MLRRLLLGFRQPQGVEHWLLQTLAKGFKQVGVTGAGARGATMQALKPPVAVGQCLHGGTGLFREHFLYYACAAFWMTGLTCLERFCMCVPCRSLENCGFRAELQVELVFGELWWFVVS